MFNKLKIFSVILFVAILYSGIFGMLLKPINQTATASTSAVDGVALPIICYNSILKDTELTGKYVITPQTLENDIKYLEHNGYEFVSAHDVIDYTNNVGCLPPKPVLLLFDGGYYNIYEYVLPILERNGARAVISVSVGKTDEYSQNGIADNVHGYLRWSEVYDIFLSSRIEVANNSYSLNSKCSAKDFHDDTRKSQDRFLTKTGFSPIIYSYPPNTKEQATDALKEMGYKMSISYNEGENIISADPDSLYMLNRHIRTSEQTSEEFFNSIMQKE